MTGPDVSHLRSRLEALYRHFHAHPELALQEHATAARIAEEVRGLTDRVPDSAGISVEMHEGVAGTGVVVVVRRGDGPTVLLRADMDGLPVREETGLPHASRATGRSRAGERVPVMHACGHDVHITCLLGALEVLLGEPALWAGTVVAVFQPAEESDNGAEAMVAAGLTDLAPRPDVAFGQHVLPGAAGPLLVGEGPVMAACDDMRIVFRGRGGHGSQPHLTIDPVLMAASFVVRLQSVVSRHVDPRQAAVVTVGHLVAGTKNNVIPDSSLVELTVRTYDRVTRDRIVATIEAMARAEAAAVGAAEPTVEVYDSLPVTDNDPLTVERVRTVFAGEFGSEAVLPMAARSGSEDFSVLPDAWGAPYCYWGLGGFDADEWRTAEARGTAGEEFPGNHAATFAPVEHPTLETGVRALVAATLEWLGTGR